MLSALYEDLAHTLNIAEELTSFHGSKTSGTSVNILGGGNFKTNSHIYSQIHKNTFFGLTATIFGPVCLEFK